MPPASRSQTSSRHGVRACCLGRLAGELGEVLVAPVPAGEPEQREPRSAAARGWPGRRPPGISFLRARSPVTPKTTSAHGSGTRGSRRSRGSRSGLAEHGPVLEVAGRGTAPRGPRRRTGRLARPAVARRSPARRCSTVGPARLRELGAARYSISSFQESTNFCTPSSSSTSHDVVDVDAERGQLVEHLRRRRRSMPATVSPRISAVVGDRLQRRLRHRVDRARRDQLDDVHRVGVRRVLDAGRGPQRPLRLGARRRQRLPPVGGEHLLVAPGRPAARWRSPPCPAAPWPRRCRACRAACRSRCRPGRRRTTPPTRSSTRSCAVRPRLLQAGQEGVHDRAVALEAEDQRDVDADALGERRR